MQFGITRVILLLVLHIGLRRTQVGLGGGHFNLKVGAVQYGDDLALAHHTVEVHIDVFHDARHLGADVDGGHGFEGARGGDARGYVHTAHRDALKGQAGLGFLAAQQQEPRAYD